MLPKHQREQRVLQRVSCGLHRQIKIKASCKQQTFPEGMEGLLLAVQFSADALNYRFVLAPFREGLIRFFASLAIVRNL